MHLPIHRRDQAAPIVRAVSGRKFIMARDPAGLIVQAVGDRKFIMARGLGVELVCEINAEQARRVIQVLGRDEDCATLATSICAYPARAPAKGSTNADS